MQELLEVFLKESTLHDSNVIYVQMYENDELKAEYRRFPVKTRLNVWSVSKAFVSVAAGIAMEEGIIALDELIYPAFESYIDEKKFHQICDITVRHLLTMSSGLKEPLFFCDNPLRYQVKDWIDYFFRYGEFAYKPGTFFLYSNFNSYILSCMIEKKVGCGLLEYLRYRLFESIGIGNPDWTLCPKGHCMAANGLYLTIDELAHFGQMILHKGEYRGKRIVASDYIDAACSKQINSYNSSEEKWDCESYGYGYLIRMAPIPGAVMMNGNYGQCCVVYPEKNAVLCVMALEGNDHKKVYRDLLNATSQYYGIEIGRM